MNKKIRTQAVFTAILSVVLVTIAFAVGRVHAEKDPPPPTAIQVTPRAPVFDEARRLEELAARRKHVADTIGPKAMLVLFSAEPRVYTNDVDFPFRQENNLYYLTNLNQKGSTLVLIPGNAQTPEILFLPRRSPIEE